jgi:hypothetical protein
MADIVVCGDLEGEIEKIIEKIIVSDLPNSNNSLRRWGDLGRMATKKFGHLRSMIALLQDRLTDELVRAIMTLAN